jgi:hypothetical protein
LQSRLSGRCLGFRVLCRQAKQRQLPPYNGSVAAVAVAVAVLAVAARRLVLLI